MWNNRGKYQISFSTSQRINYSHAKKKNEKYCRDNESEDERKSLINNFCLENYECERSMSGERKLPSLNKQIIHEKSIARIYESHGGINEEDFY